MNSPAKILIVDDEPSIRFYLEEMLTLDGHAVVPVKSGEEALLHIDKEEFDLALVDLKLEGISGIDVLKALREQTPYTVVIVLTAHASLETAVEALRQGAYDYLFKPSKTTELRESIRQGLRKRQQELQQRDLNLLRQLEKNLGGSLRELLTSALDRASTHDSPSKQANEKAGRFLQRGTLIVDFMRHVITLDGKLLELSPTEFSVLAYLATEAPRVVPPQELICEVRGYDTDSEEASDLVRYYIHRIRQKIKATTGKTDLIRTVRGIGYGLGEEGSKLTFPE